MPELCLDERGRTGRDRSRLFGTEDLRSSKPHLCWAQNVGGTGRHEPGAAAVLRVVW